MKYIDLTKGLKTVINDDDFEIVKYRSWYASKVGNTYVARSDKPERINMHTLIMDPPAGYEVDHIDGNSLNNLRSNLRICTHQQNLSNQRKQRHTSSIYKGVSWNKTAKRWHAYIKIKGKRVHLGYYDTQEEAACRYNAAAAILFGCFAKLNPTKKEK